LYIPFLGAKAWNFVDRLAAFEGIEAGFSVEFRNIKKD